MKFAGTHSVSADEMARAPSTHSAKMTRHDGARTFERYTDNGFDLLQGRQGRLPPVPFSGAGRQLSTSEAKVTAARNVCHIQRTDPKEKETSLASASLPPKRNDGRAKGATATSSLSSSSVSGRSLTPNASSLKLSALFWAEVRKRREKEEDGSKWQRRKLQCHEIREMLLNE